MFGDLTKRVLMVYKADTASAQADIKKLSLTQKEHAQALKKDLDAQNVGLEAQIGKYASYAAKAAAAFGAIKVGLDSMEFYYERQELREKAQGHSIAALQAATRGLVSETELLKFAQAANHGVMKASSDELVTMAKAMDVYAERGHNATEVQAAFNEYLQTGKSKTLKDYGLQINEARGSVEQFKEVMQQLNAVAKDQASIETDARDKWDASKISMRDTIAQLKESAGGLVAEFQPAMVGLIELLNKSAEGWGNIFRAIKEGIAELPEWYTHARATEELNNKIKLQQEEIRKQHEKMNETMAERARLDAELLDMERRIALSFVSMMNPEWQQRMLGIGKFLGGGISSGMQDGMGKFLGLLGISAGRIDLDEKEMTAAAAKIKSSIKGASLAPKVTIEIEIPDAAKLKAKAEELSAAWAAAQEEARSQSVEEFQGYGFAADIEALPEMMGSAEEIRAQYEQFNAERSESFLSSVFGPIEEFNIYAEGWNLLKDSATAGFTAFITGSESIGAAMKKALSSGLMSLSIEMFTQSLKHAAYAVGSLAMGNAAGAATHGKAAAMFLAGAVTVGKIGASMGAGSGAPAGAGGSAGSIGPSTRSASIPSGEGISSGRSISIIVGDDFADDSPRKRQQKAERLVKMGLRSSREVVFA